MSALSGNVRRVRILVLGSGGILRIAGAMKDGLQWLSQQSGVWSSVLQFLQPRELCFLNCLSKDCWLVHDNDIAWHLVYLRTFNPISALWADLAHPTKHTVVRNKASYVAAYTAMMENIAAIKEERSEEEAFEAIRAPRAVEELRRMPRLSENAIVRFWRGLWSSR